MAKARKETELLLKRIRSTSDYRARDLLRLLPTVTVARRAPHEEVGGAETYVGIAVNVNRVFQIANDTRKREMLKRKGMRSVESLREIAATWPDHRWYFVMGEDAFDDLDSWYEPAALFAIAAPVVAPRPGATGTRPRTWNGIAVRWLEGEEIDLDSTSLRDDLARGAIPQGIAPKVLAYIREHGLYREQPA